MVLGGVEIADQYSGERIAQRLVHDCFAPTPPQEVAFGGGAEIPHVAVGPALTPAGFVGVDHWAGADAVQDRVNGAGDAGRDGNRWNGPGSHQPRLEPLIIHHRFPTQITPAATRKADCGQAPRPARRKRQKGAATNSAT